MPGLTILINWLSIYKLDLVCIRVLSLTLSCAPEGMGEAVLRLSAIDVHISRANAQDSSCKFGFSVNAFLCPGWYGDMR